MFIINKNITTPEGFQITGGVYAKISGFGYDENSGIAIVGLSFYKDEECCTANMRPISIPNMSPSLNLPMSPADFKSADIYTVLQPKVQAALAAFFGAQNVVAS